MKYSFLLVCIFVFLSCNDKQQTNNQEKEKNAQNKVIDPTKANTEALVAEAKALFIMKNYYEANNKLKDAINQDAANHEAHYWEGRCYEVAKEHDLAMKSYQRAEELGNKNVSVRLVIYYFFDGNFLKSQNSLEKTLEVKNDKDINSSLQLKIDIIHCIFSAMKNNIDAAKEKLKTLEIDPILLEEDLELLTLNDYLQALLQRSNNPDRAISYFENIVSGQYQKLAEKAVLQIAQIYIEQKNLDKALSVLKWNLEYIPSNDIKFAIATILVHQEKLEELDSYANTILESSLPHIEKVVVLLLNNKKLDKSLSLAKKILEKYASSDIAHFVIAQVYTTKKLYQPAQKHYEQTILLTESPEVKAYSLSATAGIDISIGKVEEGIEKLEKAIEVNPKALNTYIFLAQAHIFHKKFEDAIQVYQNAAKIFPENASIPIQIINIYMRIKNWQKAGELASKVLKQNPDSVEASTLLATSFHMRGEKEKAQEIYNSIMSKHPNNLGIAANNLATLLADLEENLDYAEELARKAISITKHPSAVDTLAWIFYHQKKYEEAEKLLVQILPMRKESPYVNYHYAKVLAALKNKDAIQYFEKALELADESFPNYLDCQKQIQILNNK